MSTMSRQFASSSFFFVEWHGQPVVSLLHIWIRSTGCTQHQLAYSGFSVLTHTIKKNLHDPTNFNFLLFSINLL